MILGELQKELKNRNRNSIIQIPEFHSYRGYYDQLAIDVSSYTTSVSSVLSEIDEILGGRIFRGYRGGEYTYDENTNIYLARIGEASDTILSHLRLNSEGVLQFAGTTYLI